MALEVARAGDVLTVWRLDRLGRSLHDLILLSRRLDELGIGLMSLQEKIDTSSSGGDSCSKWSGNGAGSENGGADKMTQ